MLFKSLLKHGREARKILISITCKNTCFIILRIHHFQKSKLRKEMNRDLLILYKGEEYARNDPYGIRDEVGGTFNYYICTYRKKGDGIHQNENISKPEYTSVY